MLPWRGDETLVGTTETPFSGDPNQVRPLPGEIAYLQDVVAHHLPGRALDPVSAFAGLRVLPGGPGSPFVRHRETLIATEANRPARMVSVCGGKLTTYRIAALRVLARLGPALPVRSRRGDTRQLPLRPDCA
jgi:glycerol-3-phosphate dehydrogenase